MEPSEKKKGVEKNGRTSGEKITMLGQKGEMSKEAPLDKAVEQRIVRRALCLLEDIGRDTVSGKGQGTTSGRVMEGCPYGILLNLDLVVSV